MTQVADNKRLPGLGSNLGDSLITNGFASVIGRFNADCLTNSMHGDRARRPRERIDMRVYVLHDVAHEDDDGERAAKQLCKGA